MKTQLLFITAMLLFNAGFASKNKNATNKNYSDSTAISKKAQKEIILQNKYNAMDSLLENKQFVLEANFLENQRGRRTFVLSNLNFVLVDSTYSILQVGSSYGLGANGVGGVTAKGTITHWEINKNDKDKTFYLNWSLITNIGIYDVRMNVDASGYAKADISGLRAGRLTYEGNIIPLDESSIYQGRTP